MPKADPLFCKECGEPYEVTETETYRNLQCKCSIISLSKTVRVKVEQANG